jgi:hypothetical protein
MSLEIQLILAAVLSVVALILLTDPFPFQRCRILAGERILWTQRGRDIQILDGDGNDSFSPRLSAGSSPQFGDPLGRNQFPLVEAPHSPNACFTYLGAGLPKARILS